MSQYRYRSVIRKHAEQVKRDFEDDVSIPLPQCYKETDNDVDAENRSESQYRYRSVIRKH